MKTNESDLVERNENPVALNTIDAEKLLATPLPPMKYYVDGILPQGLSILAGSPKAGKSWLWREAPRRASPGWRCGSVCRSPAGSRYGSGL